MLTNDLLKGAKAASEYTGGVITPRQVYRLADEGKLPAIRLNKTLFFRKSEIEAVFQSSAGEAA